MSKARLLAQLGNAYDDGALSNRNMVTNGSMQVAQRSMGPVAVAPYNYNTADRMRFSLGGAGSTWTQEVVADQDVGDFVGNALKNTCNTAGSSVSGNNIRLELQDMERFVGKEMTLSFYAKSDAPITLKPQVFGDTLVDLDTFTLTTSYQRYVSTFTAPALTTKSFFDLSLRVDDSVVTSHYMTGIQLEVGDTATPFEHRSYADELAKCQRYLYRINGNSADQTMIGMGYFYGMTTTRHIVHYPVTMRSSPSVSANALDALRDTANDSAVTLGSSLDESIYSCGLNISGVTSTSVGEGSILRLKNTTSAYISFDAEL